MPRLDNKIKLYTKPKVERQSWGSDTDFYRQSAWIKLRNAFREQNPLCVECLKENNVVSIIGNNGVVDHIKPRSKYPELEYEWSNLQSLCHVHHNKKSAKEK